MIATHETLIKRCLPLAKKVVEMVALRNFIRDPLPHSWLPLPLFLESLYVRFMDVTKDKIPVPVRTTDWWETLFCSAGSSGGCLNMGQNVSMVPAEIFSRTEGLSWRKRVGCWGWKRGNPFPLTRKRHVFGFPSGSSSAAGAETFSLVVLNVFLSPFQDDHLNAFLESISSRVDSWIKDM